VFNTIKKTFIKILHRVINIDDNQTLYAFYDLECSPATFDFIYFLVLAERARPKLNCNYLQIVFVPGSANGFRNSDLDNYQSQSEYDIDYMHWRKNNILIQSCALLESIGGITNCNSRMEAEAIMSLIATNIFPKGYAVKYPIQNYYLNLVVNAKDLVPSLNARKEPKRFINNWILNHAKNKKVVTITLRETGYQKNRNSNLKEWSDFAQKIDTKDYYPVFIRDTEAVFKPTPKELDGFVIFNEISFNMELRASLYQLSYLNMFVNGGPYVLGRNLKNSYSLIFKMVTPGVPNSEEQFWKNHGVEPGDQYPPYSVFSKLVWEDDRSEIIEREFKDMCRTISKIKK